MVAFRKFAQNKLGKNNLSNDIRKEQNPILSDHFLRQNITLVSFDQSTN